MSRAFVKEDDVGLEQAPERAIGDERNLVTPQGLALIDAELERLAQRDGSDPIVARDLRYWTVRRETAELIEMPEDTSTVKFGLTVTLEREDGSTQSYRIVGIDEADPAKGKLSYMAPLAKKLIGRKAGDLVQFRNEEFEITAIAR